MTLYSSTTKLAFFTASYQTTNNIILLANSQEEALTLYKQLQFFNKNNREILYLPSLDNIPYDSTPPNTEIMAERAKLLASLANNIHKQAILVTYTPNLLLKLPPIDLLKQTILELRVGMKVTINTLLEFLVNNGYQRSAVAVDSGEFAVRGDIVDIALPGKEAYRINFAFDEVESIKNLNKESQISAEVQQNILLAPTNEIILNPQTINNFRDNYLRNFGVNYNNTPLYSSIMKGRKFIGYENLLPLFYNHFNSLIDYLQNHNKFLIIYTAETHGIINDFYQSYQQSYDIRINTNKLSRDYFYPALPPEQFLITKQIVENVLKADNNILFSEINDEPTNSNSKEILEYLLDKKQNSGSIDIFKKLAISLKKCPILTPIILSGSEIQQQKINDIINNAQYPHATINNLSEAKAGYFNLARLEAQESFNVSNYVFINDVDIFGKKIVDIVTQDTKKRLKNLLAEFDHLESGQLVVHKKHGIGKFLVVETITVSGQKHDCLKISYANDDILYLPVENIEALTKYGNEEAELDKLGSAHWQRRCAQVKKRVTELAGTLIKVTAKRQLDKVEITEVEPLEYERFCAKFSYVETEDQLRSIEEIKADLSSGKLMDRLICGDVGFGKTEIAIRACYMVAKNIHDYKPQVAIIAPTTILCRQHYNRFVERFAGTNLTIAQLSRLTNTKDIELIKKQISEGDINIVIGTHSLLAKDLKFFNLKLLVIDEEQHFGVKQKERLKELKEHLHIMYLSATPIPRTLQMSLLGLKDLSLITTPPISRLSIKSTVMPLDKVIIADALKREQARGGRSFYVCPHIEDIPYIEEVLQKIVPDLRYKVAHGQMPATTVDNVMNDFYDGKIDILLSTTIIESGIDVPAAGTMIIHKANLLGLSQLYQLRGRVGRSKLRGYVYFTTMPNINLTTEATKRLEILSSIDALGAGFSIASHDMDIRGFGNLIGEQQSGHIREVGVELYQEMLDEAIYLLQTPTEKQKSTVEEFIPTINLNLPILIPELYIKDSDLRLAIYRRIGLLTDEQEIDNFRLEMHDRFGKIPEEFNNLLKLVVLKQLCKKLYIESIDTGSAGFVCRFHPQITDKFDMSKIINSLMKKYSDNIKVKPDNKLAFVTTNLTKQTITNMNNPENIIAVIQSFLTYLIKIISPFS